MTLKQLHYIYNILDKCYNELVSHTIMSHEEDRFAVRLDRCISLIGKEIDKKGGER